MQVHRISTQKLRTRLSYSPFGVWGHDPRTMRAEVKKCIAEGVYETVPYSTHWFYTELTRHAARIAYLYTQQIEPLELDVGIPSLGYWPEHLLTDGNHRFCAALLRGDVTVPVIFSGSVEEFEQLFDIVVEETVV